MFESKGKKELNAKYNKLQGMNNSNVKRKKSTFKTVAEGQESNTVFGELKLSEKLNIEL